MGHRECEYEGNIASVRAVEDCIRATKKFTEGIRTLRVNHPIQGEDFTSRVFCKYYEVYPYVDLDKKYPILEVIGIAFDLAWRDTPCIDVVFRYDYRSNKASVTIRDGVVAVKELSNNIPNIGKALVEITNGHKDEG